MSACVIFFCFVFFFQAEDGIRDLTMTGVQTCALPILGYDFFTYYFTLVLTPMTFLSGVYFPISQMPDWLQTVAAVLPLTAAVELVRPLMIGEAPAQWLRPLAVLAAYAFGGYYLALVLTRRRFFK